MKNKVIGSLIVVTGLLFAGALLLKSHVSEVDDKLYSLGFITGLSAVMTKLLIKEQ